MLEFWLPGLFPNHLPRSGFQKGEEMSSKGREGSRICSLDATSAGA